MTRHVFTMLASVLVAVLCIFALGTLSYDWSYNADVTFGGHIGFLAPILLGIGLFAAGVLFGYAETAHIDDLADYEWLRQYDAYLNGEFDEVHHVSV